MAEARRKRNPAANKGGTPPKPTFMASHVEPQTRHAVRYESQMRVRSECNLTPGSKGNDATLYSPRHQEGTKNVTTRQRDPPRLISKRKILLHRKKSCCTLFAAAFFPTTSLIAQFQPLGLQYQPASAEVLQRARTITEGRILVTSSETHV